MGEPDASPYPVGPCPESTSCTVHVPAAALQAMRPGDRVPLTTAGSAPPADMAARAGADRSLVSLGQGRFHRVEARKPVTGGAKHGTGGRSGVSDPRPPPPNSGENSRWGRWRKREDSPAGPLRNSLGDTSACARHLAALEHAGCREAPPVAGEFDSRRAVGAECLAKPRRSR